MWRPQTLVGLAILAGLGLYATDGGDRLLKQENARLRGALATAAKAEAAATNASRELEHENARLRAQLLESATAAAAAAVAATGAPAPKVNLPCPGGANNKPAVPPAPIRTLKKKGEIPHVLQEEGLKVGVEVGVFKGGFSNWVLSNWPKCRRGRKHTRPPPQRSPTHPSTTATASTSAATATCSACRCEKYYMVDLWAAQENYRQMDNATTAKNLERMETARRNVARFGNKAVLVRKSSVEAAKQFEDGSVDFVYLDARHTYDAVMEDMEAWWPKARSRPIWPPVPPPLPPLRRSERRTGWRRGRCGLVASWPARTTWTPTRCGG